MTGKVGVVIEQDEQGCNERLLLPVSREADHAGRNQA
jgi:hypothetical protein